MALIEAEENMNGEAPRDVEEPARPVSVGELAAHVPVALRIMGQSENQVDLFVAAFGNPPPKGKNGRVDPEWHGDPLAYERARRFHDTVKQVGSLVDRGVYEGLLAAHMERHGEAMGPAWDMLVDLCDGGEGGG